MAITRIAMPGKIRERVVPSAEQRKQANKAASGIAGLGSWEQTREGCDFWNSVYERLSNIASGDELLDEEE